MPIVAKTLTRGAALACVPFTLLLASCGSITEKAVERGTEELIERETGGSVDIDLDSDGGSVSIETEDGTIEYGTDEDGGFTAETDDGSYQAGSDVDLPDGFPDVPLPDGLTVQTAFAGGGDFQVSGFVDGSAEDVYDDLLAAFRDRGHEPTGDYAGTSGDSFSGGATFDDVDGATVVLGVVDIGDGTTSVSYSIDG